MLSPTQETLIGMFDSVWFWGFVRKIVTKLTEMIVTASAKANMYVLVAVNPMRPMLKFRNDCSAGILSCLRKRENLDATYPSYFSEIISRS